MHTTGRGGGRETRLLLGTIAIATAMLFLLAHFRFPEQAALLPGGTAAAPLERLAARATFDELAGAIAELERRISPSIVVVPVGSGRGHTSYLPAVRVAPERAVALAGAGERITASPGGEAPIVLARDVTRNLAVLQVAARPGDVVTPRTGSPRPGPRYVAIVEAAAQGIALRPVYVGRMDLFQDPATGDSLLSIAAVQHIMPRGAAIFTLDARFMGFARESAGLVSILPAETLLAAADAAVPVVGVQGELGLDVQTLTPPLARGLGTASGVLISHVESSVDGEIRALDVIQAIDGLRVNSVAAYQQILATKAPGASVALTLWRGGRTVVAVAAVQPAGTASLARGDPGLLLRSQPGRGIEVLESEPGSPSANAGLRPGDVVVAVGNETPADAADVQTAYAAARKGEGLLLRFRRGTHHHVTVLEK